MAVKLEEALERFDLPEFKSTWGRINRGIEKESLRVNGDGRISQQAHPHALGSALTHPYITTDYSEALIELITPVSNGIDDTLEFLGDLHRFVYQALPEDEYLWVASMPCLLENEAEIPLAEYGHSNIGRLKNLYREGLGHRYGRLMQTIAGIHYNFSMPDHFWEDFRALRGQSGESLQDFRTRQYLHLIRNFHRKSWLLLYLFGASPAVCKCFTRGREHDLIEFDEATLYLPDATCLRMGNLGYKSDAQKSIFICYNELDNYIDSLQQAMATPYAAYEAIGTRDGDKYLQMNSNLLQLENEFYASIRPKRVGEAGKRPLTLLQEEGIQYIEVRALDLDPYLPLGIDAEQIRFLDSFLLHCLLSDSPECTREEYFEVEENIARTVNRGRDPQLALQRGGQDVLLREWGETLLQDVEHSAALLDAAHDTAAYSRALSQQQAKIADASLTPSARILEDMRNSGQPFHSFSRELSLKTRDWCQQKALSTARAAHFRQASEQSWIDQQKIEEEDKHSFDEFLAEWNDYRVK